MQILCFYYVPLVWFWYQLTFFKHFQVQNTIYVAGQIAMQPADLSIIPGGSTPEARLSLRHVARVISAVQSRCDMTHITMGICYVTRAEYIKKAEKEWERALEQSDNCVSIIALYFITFWGTCVIFFYIYDYMCTDCLLFQLSVCILYFIWIPS